MTSYFARHFCIRVRGLFAASLFLKKMVLKCNSCKHAIRNHHFYRSEASQLGVVVGPAVSAFLAALVGKALKK